MPKTKSREEHINPLKVPISLYHQIKELAPQMPDGLSSTNYQSYGLETQLLKFPKFAGILVKSYMLGQQLLIVTRERHQNIIFPFRNRQHILIQFINF